MEMGASKPSTPHGIALVSVLWLLMLLSIIAISFGTTIRIEAKTTRNVMEYAKSRALAEAGVAAAIYQLSRQTEDETEQPWITDGFAYPLTVGDEQVFVTIFDENGKVDINHAETELMAAVLTASGIDPALVDIILNVIAKRREGDRESQADSAPSASTAKFESLGELRQALEIPADQFRRIEPYLTVYSGEAGVNPSTAPRDVLLALPNVDADQVRFLLEARTLRHQSEYRAPLPKLSNVERWLSEASGPVYTIRAEATVGDDTSFVREAVAWLGRESRVPYRYLDWRRGKMP